MRAEVREETAGKPYIVLLCESGLELDVVGRLLESSDVDIAPVVKSSDAGVTTVVGLQVIVGKQVVPKGKEKEVKGGRKPEAAKK